MKDVIMNLLTYATLVQFAIGSIVVFLLLFRTLLFLIKLIPIETVVFSEMIEYFIRKDEFRKWRSGHYKSK